MTSGLQSPTITGSAMLCPLRHAWCFAYQMLDYAYVGIISRRNVQIDVQGGMVLTVTLNSALDVTHHVHRADWDGVNRPHQVLTRPGGKGLNVARVLHTLSASARAIGLAGQAVRAGLAAAGVPADFTPIAGPTRRTFTVVDEAAGRVAAFNEPRPAVSEGEYPRPGRGRRRRAPADLRRGRRRDGLPWPPRPARRHPRAELVEQAASLGFGSTMFDASARYAENVAATAGVAAWGGGGAC